MAATAIPKAGSKTAASASVRSPSASSSSTSLSGARQQRGGNAMNGAPARSRTQLEGTSGGSDAARDASSTDQLAQNKLVFFMGSIIGKPVTLTVKSSEQFTGIFSGASLDTQEQRYVLKMTKRASTLGDGQMNGEASSSDDYIGFGEDHVKVFDVADVANLAAHDVIPDKLIARFPNGTSSALRTDAEISARFGSSQRDLQPWLDTGDSTTDLSLNGAGGASWDQFDTNERLFGLKTDYDENIYTTTIDRSHPSYKKRVAAAERKAREIESSTTTNSHVAEERNIVYNDADLDEESKFSGVTREFPPLGSSHANRYTPPALRAPTGQQTVPGAPVDPAIITSQLVKPDNQTTKQPKNQAMGLSTSSSSTAQKENSAPSGEATAPTSTQSNAARNAELTETARQAVQDTEKDTKTVATPLNLSQKSGIIAGRPTGAAANATATVERDVLKSFKDFAGQEKMRIHERQRSHAKREKDVKLNDLKKFSENFTLKSKVPTDMLGILAKDKKRQEEIVEKSERQLAESSPKKSVTTTIDQKITQGANLQRSEDVSKATIGFSERQHARGGRSGQTSRNFSGEHGPQGQARPLPGTLGQRLLAQPQYAPKAMPPIQPLPPDMPMPGPRPAPVRTDMHTGSGAMNNPVFNAKATEFKPNPSASVFSPGAGPSSPAKPIPSSQQRSPVRASFFGNTRPQKSTKISIKDGFNPISRMKKEVEQDKKTKEFTANGGIPQAYRTLPTWDVSEENKEKTYIDIFDKASSTTSAITANGPIPHQHQLPLHLQSGIPSFPSPHPQQQPPRHSYQQYHGHGRDHHFDDHRMQPSSSNSSYMPSPRHHHGAPVQGSPMMPPVGPVHGQPMHGYMMPHGQGMQMYRPPGPPFVGSQGANMGGAVMMNQPGGPYMGVPLQQPIHYSPANGQAFPMAPVPPQHANGYGSPRAGPMMMMPQGSQQGHASPYMYLSHSQQGNQVYPQQQPPQMMMRGNSFMGGQQAYGYNTHMPQQYPMQPRGPHFGGNFAHQQMPPASQVGPQGQTSGPAINHHGEMEEGK